MGPVNDECLPDTSCVSQFVSPQQSKRDGCGSIS